jgi:hypothetical protein
MTITIPPKIHQISTKLPREGIIKIDIEEGIPILRSVDTIQERIEFFLSQQITKKLTIEEEQELNFYEEIDDYLSFLNRLTRNLYLTQNQG